MPPPAKGRGAPSAPRRPEERNKLFYYGIFLEIKYNNRRIRWRDALLWPCDACFAFLLRVPRVWRVRPGFSASGNLARVANCDLENFRSVAGCDAGERTVINTNESWENQAKRGRCPIVSPENGDGTSLKCRETIDLNHKTQISAINTEKGDISGHFGSQPVRLSFCRCESGRGK
jgi:hypothetical protein